MERVERLLKLGTYAFVEAERILSGIEPLDPDYSTDESAKSANQMELFHKRVIDAICAGQAAAADAVAHREALLRERYQSLVKVMLKP